MGDLGMMVSEAQYVRLERAAMELGRRHGLSAASWVVIDSDATARTILDDEWETPAPLSGEWAGDPLPRDILAEIAGDAVVDIEDDQEEDFDDVLTAYENSYGAAYYENVSDRASRYLGRPAEPMA